MHTLGHSGMSLAGAGHVGGLGDASMTTMAAPATAVGGAATVTGADCARGACGGHGMAGWAVCLAVLGGLTLVVLLAVLRCLRPAICAAGASTAGYPRAARPPPLAAAGVIVACTVRLRV